MTIVLKTFEFESNRHYIEAKCRACGERLLIMDGDDSYCEYTSEYNSKTKREKGVFAIYCALCAKTRSGQ